MRTNKSKKHFRLVLVYHGGITKAVDVWASSLEVAERRVLKRNPAALRIRKPGDNDV